MDHNCTAQGIDDSIRQICQSLQDFGNAQAQCHQDTESPGSCATGRGGCGAGGKFGNGQFANLVMTVCKFGNDSLVTLRRSVISTLKAPAAAPQAAADAAREEGRRLAEEARQKAEA